MNLPEWLKKFNQETEKLDQAVPVETSNRKLYIFGNSFSMDDTDGKGNVPYHLLWTSMLVKEFNCEQINISVPGNPIGSIANQIELRRDRIYYNDILIVFLGVIRTHFFFEDRPYISSSRAMEFYDCPEEILPEEKEAIKQYEKWLINPTNEKLFTLNFLHNLDDLTRRLNLKTVVIRTYPHPAYDDDITDERYPNLIISKGNIWKQSEGEFESKHLFDFLNPKTFNFLFDFRTNHFTVENHEVLAGKLINSIRDGVPLDLNTGFHKKNVRLADRKELIDFLNQLNSNNNP
jgi:hypothetical protein